LEKWVGLVFIGTYWYVKHPLCLDLSYFVDFFLDGHKI
jgi:hypothetical protein